MTVDAASPSTARRTAPGSSAAALYQRGVADVNAGRYAAARRVLARASAAAEADGDVDLAARVAGTTGFLLAISSDAAAGERLCRQALHRPGISRETTAILQGQLGSIDMSRGRLDSAADWLGRSIRGLAHDPVRAANMRMNRALVEMDRGNFASAKADLEWAEQAYLDAGDLLAAGQAVHNHGYVSMLEGDVVTALRTMERVRAPLDAESELWAATNESDRAQALADAGLTGEAEAALANVARVFGTLRAVREQAEAEYALARSLLRHDAAGAARAASAAARRFRRLGSDARALRAEAVRQRARLLAAGEDRAGSGRMRRLPSAEEIASLARELEAAGIAGDAAILRLAERIARLRRSGLDTRDPIVRTTSGLPLEAALTAAELRSLRAGAAGREAEARRQAERGLELLERSRQATGSLELQGASIMLGRGLLVAGLSSALRSGRPAVVFHWSERTRHMSTQVVPLRPPPDPEAAADLAELRRIRAASPDGEWLSTPRAAFLRDRARERQWSQTGTAGLEGRVGLDEAQAALTHDEAILSFVHDGRSLVALAVGPADVRLVHVDVSAARTAIAGLRSDLDMTASIRTGPLASVVRSSLEARLRRLATCLLPHDLRGILDAPRIVITVPGILSGIPWTMLPDLRGRAVTVTPSASKWVRGRLTSSSGARTAAFAVGPNVPRGEEEVTRAARSWVSPVILRDAGATVDAVAEVAAGADVLHIAAHGRHSVDNPQFSGLDLSDGALFGYDIDRMPRIPQTVVLSACELGRSSVRWGEEAAGMTRAWLHAGTRCVVASPVVVGDDIACDLLGAMHARLAAGDPPAVALGRASEESGVVAPFLAHGAGF
ncbi:CHAT domain-containing protein [Microbacterium sp. BK668]|uniref:CHAT domain-containing protein n=1 Tax=Microbacterium sp. BK668 TaxID=2512118 RepID=UPI00105B7CDF|nr:CHAT domain-containing protein [Microbacterium sp. BK668]TDN92636.1 CHAT domain-containing protein [Microbacterium sp. BK668]